MAGTETNGLDSGKTSQSLDTREALLSLSLWKETQTTLLLLRPHLMRPTSTHPPILIPPHMEAPRTIPAIRAHLILLTVAHTIQQLMLLT